MGNEEGAPQQASEDNGETTAAKLALKAGESLVSIFITAGSLVGFVAFAGAVVLWTRLDAVQVPPQQAIDVAPQGELVAIGGAILLVFGFFGALAMLGAFLVDRNARPTPGMARALILLLAIEGIVAIISVEGLSKLATVVDAELFVLPLAIVWLATTADRFGILVDDLERRKRERCEPEKRYGLLRSRPCVPVESRVARRRLLWVLAPIIPLALAMVAAAVLIAINGSDCAMGAVLSGGGVAFVAVFAILLRRDRGESTREGGCRCNTAQATGTTGAVKARAAARPRDAAGPAESERRGGLLGLLAGLLAVLFQGLGRVTRRTSVPATSPASDCEKCEENGDEPRRSLPRPCRLSLTPLGIVVSLISIGIGVFLVVWRLEFGGEWWVAVSLTAAALVVAALWRIAELVNKRLVWFGVAVFLSVPLFGTLMTATQNAAHPKVQALALIRSTDGPRESLQGLFVTETDDRVYFANIATEGCEEEKIVPKSGRLLSVPTDEVVAMSLGPSQSVKEAGKTALEMSYELTPSIETPGTSVLLPGDAARQKKAEEKEMEASGNDTRLENAGPAVRPNFGAGLNLEPENASPGDEVTLTMSAPNEKVNGFGASREGHNLRVGGVRAAIATERAHRVASAEYILASSTTGEERQIGLDKKGGYVQGDDEEFVLAESPEGEAVLDEAARDEAARDEVDVYVKLDDPRLREVGGKKVNEEGFDEDKLYVKLASADGLPSIAKTEKRTIVLAAGTPEGVKRDPEDVELAGAPLYRQAWHNNRITFTVPEEASTGVVTVECEQLAGAPLLQVSRAPTARLAVKMHPGSNRVSFDSRRSSDDGEIKSREWTVSGLALGAGRERISRALPPRTGAYRIELTVTDDDGESDTAEVHLLRLRAPYFRFSKDKPESHRVVNEIRRAVSHAASKDEPPATIEIDGHADDVGTRRYNAHLAWRRATGLEEALRSTKLAKIWDDAPQPPHLTVRAFGETCPIDRHGGRLRKNRRVELFILSSDTRLILPHTCHATYIKRGVW